ncbi:MAG: DUF308 domain-containing protein [Oscillospiraceae bacterium]|nr:DUF308 domain-containing protein [Oscillospiraceae bacterium]
MMKKINWKTFWYTNLFSLITLIAGIILTAKPDFLTSACKALGGLCCTAGGILLLLCLFPKLRFQQNISYGILFLVAGILLEVVPSLLKFLIPVLFGFWILSSSVSGMYRNFSFRQEVSGWRTGFVLCALSALLGIYVMTRPMSVMNDTVRIIGIGFLIHAVIRLISSFLGRKGYQTADDAYVDTTIQE